MIHYIEEKDPRFYISDSLIPGAGSGVFANTNIKKNDFLRIIGICIKSKTIADLIGIFIKKIHIYCFANAEVPGILIPMGFGGMVNHTDDITKRNCEITHIGGDIYYVFTKNIEKDEEILGNYGENWGGWNL